MRASRGCSHGIRSAAIRIRSSLASVRWAGRPAIAPCAIGAKALNVRPVRAISSVGRALRLHRRCREFKSLIAHQAVPQQPKAYITPMEHLAWHPYHHLPLGGAGRQTSQFRPVILCCGSKKRSLCAIVPSGAARCAGAPLSPSSSTRSPPPDDGGLAASSRH